MAGDTDELEFPDDQRLEEFTQQRGMVPLERPLRENVLDTYYREISSRRQQFLNDAEDFRKRMGWLSVGALTFGLIYGAVVVTLVLWYLMGRTGAESLSITVTKSLAAVVAQLINFLIVRQVRWISQTASNLYEQLRKDWQSLERTVAPVIIDDAWLRDHARIITMIVDDNQRDSELAMLLARFHERRFEPG